MNVEHPCVECGAPLTAQMYAKRTRVGRYKVEDTSQVIGVCASGHPEINVEGLAEYERRAAVAVLSEAGDIGGGEIRFARKALGLTQARIATLLDVAPETVSRWETGSEEMSRVSRLALLAVVLDPEALDRLVNKPARIAEVLRVSAA